MALSPGFDFEEARFLLGMANAAYEKKPGAKRSDDPCAESSYELSAVPDEQVPDPRKLGWKIATDLSPPLGDDTALCNYWQVWQHEKRLRMTKQEVRDEVKQREGDPKVKARVHTPGGEVRYDGGRSTRDAPSRSR